MLMLAAVNLLRFSPRLGASSSNRPMAAAPVSLTGGQKRSLIFVKDR